MAEHWLVTSKVAGSSPVFIEIYEKIYLFLIMNFEFFIILNFFVISAILAIILFLVSYILIYKQNDMEKISAYECGFNPFEENQGKFDIRFYLVAILFLIFDLEVAFLFPWSITLVYTQFFGFISMLIFLIILTIGFFYEWKRGALEWQ
jgi:NADH-quinone oxidoreductase subunit A